MKNKKTVKSIIALCLAVVCCLALAACGNSGDGNAAAAAPSAIYVGGSTAYSEPAPGYALTDTVTETLQLFADGTYVLTVSDLSMTVADSGVLSQFHTTLMGHYTAGDVDTDTGYRTVTLTDTTKVYASGDIYNMYTKKESMKTEVWSDDSSLTDAEKKDLMDTFGISNVKIEVNAADNTFEVFTFNTTGLVDMESSVW